MGDHEEDTNIGEVFTSMSATRLLSGGSGDDGLNGTLQDVAKLKGLHQVAVRTRCQLRETDAYTQVTHEFQIMLLSLIPTFSKFL